MNHCNAAPHQKHEWYVQSWHKSGDNQYASEYYCKYCRHKAYQKFKNVDQKEQTQEEADSFIGQLPD